MKLPSLRTTWSGGLLISVALVLISYWLEWHEGINPCLLCAMQRFMFMTLGVLFFLGMLPGERLRWLQGAIGVLAILGSGLGLWLAGRQTWLQWTPSDGTGGCSVSLAYIFKILPFQKALMQVLTGSSECAQVIWTFLHLSLAEWSFGFFGILFLISVLQTARLFRQS